MADLSPSEVNSSLDILSSSPVSTLQSSSTSSPTIPFPLISPIKCLVILKELPECLQQKSKLSELYKVRPMLTWILWDIFAVVEGTVDSWDRIKQLIHCNHIANTLQSRNVSPLRGQISYLSHFSQGEVSIPIDIHSLPQLLPCRKILLKITTKCTYKPFFTHLPKYLSPGIG